MSAFGQVPDWTKATCNAPTVLYGMHQELAAGNAVVMDFASIWCSPCVMDAPQIELIHQQFGAGNGNVKVFGFLLEDQNHNAADCADVDYWTQGISWTFPTFNEAQSIFNTYRNTYNPSNGGIPYTLVFIPDSEFPENSQLVYNNATGLGNGPGDIAQDIAALLNANGFFPVGIDEDKKEAEVMVYPNPTNETVRVRTTSDLVMLTDLSGKKIMSVKVNTGEANLNVSLLANGVYLVHTDDGKTSKLIVQH